MRRCSWWCWLFLCLFVTLSLLWLLLSPGYLGRSHRVTPEQVEVALDAPPLETFPAPPLPSPLEAPTKPPKIASTAFPGDAGDNPEGNPTLEKSEGFLQLNNGDETDGYADGDEYSHPRRRRQ